MAILDAVATKIVKEQGLVIGPLAWSEAGKVQGLTVNAQKGEVVISGGDPKSTVDRLVAQYERLFGRASHEVCKDAAEELIKNLPQTDVPMSLRSSA